MERPLRLILVEDSEDDAFLAERALARGGFDVQARRVETAEELEAALAEREWDLVLADYALPAFSGLRALEIVRRASPELPFVIVSGTINDEMAVAAMRAGAQDYVLKGNLTRLAPVVTRELHDAELRRVHRRAQDELVRLRERSAAELERSRNQLDVVLQGVAEAIVAQDAEGRVVYLNELAASVLGLDAAGRRGGDALGQDALLDAFELWDESGRRVDARELPGRNAIASGRSVERVLKMRDNARGVERWYLVTSTPIAASGETGAMVITIARDVTERKRAEDVARLLADASSALSDTLDYGATVENVARVAVPRLAEWCVAEIDEPSRVAMVHADESRHDGLRAWWEGHGAAREQARDSRASGAPELLHEVDVGGLRSVMVLPLRTHGAPFGQLVLGSATTRRFTLDDLALAEEIARRAALATENARLYHEAQEAIRVRNEFLSIASHELRTPVTALLLGLEALSRMPDEKRAPMLDERLAKAIKHTKRLATLIDSLLDVSRITTGRLTVHREELDLVELAGEVVDRFRESASKAGCVLEVKADGAIRGAWDRLRIEQVLGNLLSNSLKYGGGAPVRVVLDATPAIARLAVEDHGVGIAPHDVARIFQRFERAASVRHYGGLGLGLFIARQIVEAHGGTIDVESTPGRGSTFTVRLPRREHASRSRSAAGASGTSTG